MNQEKVAVQAQKPKDYGDPKQLVGQALNDFITAQVQLFEQLKQVSKAPPGPDGAAHRLQDYLPVEKWWLLYINPHDHKDALEQQHDDPGTFYSKDKDPTFKDAMLASFKCFLQGDVVHFADNLSWELYRQMYFKSTINQEDDINHSKYSVRLQGDVGSFTAAKTMAPDTLQQQLLGKFMVQSVMKCTGVEDKTPWPGADSYIVLHSDCLRDTFPAEGRAPDFRFRTYAGTANLEPLIRQVFIDFHVEILEAEGYKEIAKWRRQLRAIARLVQNLHIIHGFKDGNGRTNLYLVLPLLLMRHGFGLPLGGDNFLTLHNNTMNDLFSGGYTIDQMADFLWLAQDFGLMAHAKGQTDTILNHY